MSNTKTGGSGRQSKSKGSSSQREKGKDRELITIDYDTSRFIRKIEEKLYNRVWVRNGAVIESEFNLFSFEDLGFGYLDDFTARVWLNLVSFKAESIFTLCQEFMANIKHKPVTKRDSGFGCYFPRVTHGDDIWDGEVQCNKMRLKDRANLLWAIGMGKTIDLPRMMFMALCAAYELSDPRDSVPFTRLLTELFKKHGISIPVDLARIELERPIDRYSLTRSEGQRKKRKLEEGWIFDTRMIAHDEQFSRLEEQSGSHTTLLQKIKSVLIRMQARNDDDDEKDD
ncbi:hypothetical protein Acr_00g0025140 [Actinidia rufa]|uniref:Uncharacterized protein n=1 Tax=Actinidia rufa TaxID=165716 RepID=A0A7J0DDC2_9ERIC|nr:hypothetical protein Acr_00g0025140 [Actinidia rufa]